jgi:ATP-dependent exoDNAse (exonuclease V) beta subunit
MKLNIIKSKQLSIANAHPRDKNITFRDKDHTYFIAGMTKSPISVTTLIHNYFPSFDADKIIVKMMSSDKWPQSKYYGKSKESIKKEWDDNGKEASGDGTIMHKCIEDYINNIPPSHPDLKEFKMFLQYWDDMMSKYPTFKPYRTEWLVYDEEVGVAGSIDFTLQDDNENIIIVDWKRSKEIKMENRYEKGYKPFETFENCNYWHYSLQLNFYRHILETKYGKTVVYMMLIILHPNQDSYMCYPVQHIEIRPIWPAITQNIKQH